MTALDDLNDVYLNLQQDDPVYGYEDRGEAYVRAREITNSDAAVLQGAISTFSGFVGGTAYLANYILADKSEFGSATYNYSKNSSISELDVYEVSQAVADDYISSLIQLEGNSLATDLSAGEGINLSKTTWQGFGMQDQFPGNAIQDIANLVETAKINPLSLFSNLSSEGGQAGIAGAAGSLLFGKGLDDFSSRSGYQIVTGPDVGSTDLFSINSYVVKTNGDRNGDSVIDYNDGTVVMIENTTFDPTSLLAHFVVGSAAATALFDTSVPILTSVSAMAIQVLGRAGAASAWGTYAATLDWDAYRDWDLMSDFRAQLSGDGEYDFITYALNNGTGNERDFWGYAETTLGDKIGLIRNLIYDYDRNVVGTSGDDIINGGVGADSLEGGAGNDIIRGGFGDDILKGGAGNDHLNGEWGDNDVVDYSSDAGAINITVASDGTITVVDAFGGTDTLEGIESIQANSAYQNTLTISGETSLLTGDAVALGSSASSEVLMLVDVQDITTTGEGYYKITELGHDFNDSGSVSSTYSYKNHQNSVTFDFYQKTVSDGVGTDTYDQNIENTFFVGSDHGDTYVFDVSTVDTDWIEAPDMIFSGSGDDVYEASNESGGIADNYADQGLVFYSGGDDLVKSSRYPDVLWTGGVAYEPYFVPVTTMVLPLDVELSDITASLSYSYSYSIPINPDETFERYDITYYINGYGSITFEDAFVKRTLNTGGANPQTFVDGGSSAYLAIASENTAYSESLGYIYVGYSDDAGHQSSYNLSVKTTNLYDGVNYDWHKDRVALENTDAYFGTFENDTYDLSNYLLNTFYAYDGNDTITGTLGDSILYGGAGDDTLSGNTGDDQLFGGAGDDILNGNADDDLIAGNSGDDVIDGGAGHDIASYDYSINNYDIVYDDGTYIVTDLVGNDGNDILHNIEQIQFLDAVYDGTFVVSDAGSTFDDRITGSGASEVTYASLGNDWVDGLGGDDTIYGGVGDDRISGGAGEDTLDAGAGNDLIYVGEDSDQVSGGSGSDIFVITDNSGADYTVIEDFNTSEDVLDLQNFAEINSLSDLYATTNWTLSGNTYFVDLNLRINNTTLSSFNSSNVIFAEAASGGPGTTVLPDMPVYVFDGSPLIGDFIVSAPPGGVLNGYGGDDVLIGDSGTDYLYGGDDNDYLDGGSGDDVLFSGDGTNDQMNGGLGNDWYLFDGSSGFATLSDTGGVDTIIIPNALSTADLQFGISGSSLNVTETNSGYTWSGFTVTNQFGPPGNDIEYIIVQDVAYDLNDIALNGVWTVYQQIDVNELPEANDDDIAVTNAEVTKGNVFDDNGNGVDYDPNDIFLETDAVSLTGAYGSFEMDDKGYFSFNPSETFTGTQSFTYTVRDIDGNESQAMVSFTVSQGNSAPVANHDVASTDYGQAVTIDVLTNDTDAQGDTINLVTAFVQSGASLQINANDTLTYTPELGFSGVDTITYSITDGNGNESIASVSVTVNPDASATEGSAVGETIDGSQTDDTINALDGDDTVYADDGNDTVTGGDGDDMLYGGNGNDELFGQRDNDTLKGWDGIDTIRGGDGNDYIYGEDDGDYLYGDAGVDYIDGGSGNDEIYGGAGNDTLVGGAGHDTIRGGDGDDNINGVSGNDALWGEAGNDTIYGGSGSETIMGGADNDTIYGNNGNDYLHGEEGDDTIYGHTGRDFIYGEEGADILYGGGADNKDDRFIFEDVKAFQGVDTVKDFAAGEDKIDISDILDGFYTAGVDDITDFVSVSNDGTHTTISVDQDGAGSASSSQDIAVVENVIWSTVAALQGDLLV